MTHITKKLSSRFYDIYGSLPYEERFRLAWVLSRHPSLWRAHNMTIGPNRTAIVQNLARNGVHVDVEIDMWGKHPLEIMQERRSRRIEVVEHPNDFERSTIAALQFNVPLPYIIPTETNLEFYLSNLQQPNTSTTLFRGGKRETVFGHIIGPKINPYQGNDHQGEFYCGLDDLFTTGEWVEHLGMRYVKIAHPADPSKVVWLSSSLPDSFADDTFSAQAPATLT